MEVNQLVLQHQGLSTEDYLGKPFWESPAWRDLPEWKVILMKRLEQARQSLEPVLTEDVFQDPDGKTRYADASTLALRNEEGQVSGFLIQATDTTDRHQATSQARDTDSVLSSVFELLNDLFFLLDQDGTIIDYRAQDGSDLYLPPEKFLGKPMPEVLPPEVGALFIEHLKAAKVGSSITFEYSLNLSGTDRLFEARLARLPEGKRYIVVVRDITTSKLSTLESKQQLDELRRWNEVTMDREGRVLELKHEVNELAAELDRPAPYSSVVKHERDD